jgi:hypothetical protein
MSEITKQKISTIIREHILHTKIEYLIDAIGKESSKCKPIELKEKQDTSHVYIKYPNTDKTIKIPT